MILKKHPPWSFLLVLFWNQGKGSIKWTLVLIIYNGANLGDATGAMAPLVFWSWKVSKSKSRSLEWHQLFLPSFGAYENHQYIVFQKGKKLRPKWTNAKKDVQIMYYIILTLCRNSILAFKVCNNSMMS